MFAASCIRNPAPVCYLSTMLVVLDMQAQGQSRQRMDIAGYEPHGHTPRPGNNRVWSGLDGLGTDRRNQGVAADGHTY